MTVDALAARHRITISGTGAPTFVLVHGLGWDQRVWAPVAAALAVEARVVVFDLVGAGGGPGFDPERYRTLDAYADDLRAVVAATCAAPPVVVGHSIGATMALLAALAEPAAFDRLVLLSPSPRYVDDPPAYRGGMSADDVGAVLALMRQNFLGWGEAMAQRAAPQAAIAHGMLEALGQGDPAALARLAELTLASDVRARLPAVTTPTTIVACTDDALVPLEVSRGMAARIPGARLHLLDAAGHFPQLSHAERVTRLIRAAAEGA